MGSQLEEIVQQQLSSLDDTDGFASVWAELLQQGGGDKEAARPPPLWGGRGKGGRGLARRTYQPKDIVVEDVRLEFVGVRDASTKEIQLPSKVLLEGGTTLKLLAGHVYALVGRNGVGKSTLLRRIHAGMIPGFPPHISTLYVPQEILLEGHPLQGADCCTPLEMLQDEFRAFAKKSNVNIQYQIELLEAQLDQLGDQDEEMMEELCQQISDLQDEVDNNLSSDDGSSTVTQEAKLALEFFGISDGSSQSPYRDLSPGQRKKVALAVALLCAGTVPSSQQLLLCFDEPTNHLDVPGLIKLRQFLLETQHSTNRTVLLVSHDTDLMNDVATDIITFSHVQKSLSYFPGNYWQYQRHRAQAELHTLRQQVSLDKKRNHMVQNIHHLQAQPAPKRGGNRKKAKAIAAQRRKLERTGIEKDEHGHRWTQQTADGGIRFGVGIKAGALNGIDASTRRDLSRAELLQLAEASIRPPPDKAVQFVFRDNTSTWGEPLILAMDVGHGYGQIGKETGTASVVQEDGQLIIAKKEGYLFDCVDLCINEGRIYCILGLNASGKSTLLRILAKREEPLEGSVHHANNIQVGYLDQDAMDELLQEASSSPDVATALSYLAQRFPRKTEQELRGEMTNFGLSPQQATTNVRFLSGGERCRLCLAALMLENPHVLCLDNPTSNLDVESVEALIYGLQRWKGGTVIMVSHDANLVRSLEAECAVLVEHEGKLRRIEGSVDDYLRTFKY